MRRPRVTALKIDINGYIFFGCGNLMKDEPGIGAYHYLSCGTFEEQNGCTLSDFARSTPPDKWMTIEDLGLKWRMK